MAGNLGITHLAARKIMAEEFEAAENQPLRDWARSSTPNTSNRRSKLKRKSEREVATTALDRPAPMRVRAMVRAWPPPIIKLQPMLAGIMRKTWLMQASGRRDPRCRAPVPGNRAGSTAHRLGQPGRGRSHDYTDHQRRAGQRG